MTGFWYPYSSMEEAQRRLGAFADRAVGPACGISFCDGRSLSVLRRPRAGNTGATWMNVLVQHIAVPPPPPAPRGVMQKIGHWFENAMAAYGEAELRRSEAELAASRAELRLLHDDVWLPAHQFMVRHKWAADGVAVAADVIGVVALVGLIIAAPEIIAAGTVLGLAALGTGALAGGASVVLLAIDGTVFVTEVSGNEVVSRKIEDNRTVQKIRIAATLALLPDLPVGGTRALAEFRALGAEAREGSAVATKLDEAAEAQRARTAKIRNPGKHPGPVQRHLHRAKVLAGEAQEKRLEVIQLQGKMSALRHFELGAVPAGSAVSQVELAGAPPSMLMNKEDIEADETMLEKLVAPEHGMPKDVQFEVIMSGSKPVGKK